MSSPAPIISERLRRGLKARSRDRAKCKVHQFACFLGHEEFRTDFASPLKNQPLGAASAYEQADDAARNCEDDLRQGFDKRSGESGFWEPPKRKHQNWASQIRQYFEALTLTLIYSGLGETIREDQAGNRPRTAKESWIFEHFEGKDDPDFRAIYESGDELRQQRNELTHRYRVEEKSGKRHVKAVHSDSFKRSTSHAKRLIHALARQYEKHFESETPGEKRSET